MKPQTEIVCIKNVTLEGDDDCLPATLEVEIGDEFEVMVFEDGHALIDYGTEFYDIPKNIMERCFEIVHKDKPT